MVAVDLLVQDVLLLGFRRNADLNSENEKEKVHGDLS
jgi:hypothetical protein